MPAVFLVGDRANEYPLRLDELDRRLRALENLSGIGIVTRWRIRRAVKKARLAAKGG